MRVERQGRYECILATIAALADRPLAEVRAHALKVGHVRKWSSIFHTVARRRAGKPTFWDAVRLTADHFGGLPLMTCVGSASDRNGTASSSRPIPTLPTVGRGVVRFKKSGGGTGHIVPWEDGLIYDPGDAVIVGRTLAGYLAENQWAILDFIRTVGPVHFNPEDNPVPTPDMGY